MKISQHTQKYGEEYPRPTCNQHPPVRINLYPFLFQFYIYHTPPHPPNYLEANSMHITSSVIQYVSLKDTALL